MIRHKKQHKPYSVTLEMTYGCNRRCILCFRQVRTLKRNELYFMNLETAQLIAKKLKPFDPLRLQFDYRGEPFLNPKWDKIIKIFRKTLPNSPIHVMSNGDNVNHKIAKKFFAVGGNILSLDCYDGTFDSRKDYYKSNKFYSVYIDGETKFSAYTRQDPKTTRVLLLIRDNFEENRRGTREWNNLAGNIDFNKGETLGIKPLTKPLEKQCVMPFNNLAIRYNGDIRLCCLDGANNTSPYGNIKNTDLEHFWYNNKKLNTIRTLLSNKLRVKYPCNQCDYFGGGRFGFLPKYPTLSDEKVEEIKSKYS